MSPKKRRPFDSLVRGLPKQGVNFGLEVNQYGYQWIVCLKFVSISTSDL